MIIGFTGSQKGMTTTQFDILCELITEINPTAAHHGDCIGADATFHEVCDLLEIPIVIHPPADTSRRAFCEGATAVNTPEDYLVRNHNIVDEVDAMIVVPRTAKETLRSGTWATWRYAKKQDKEIFLISPEIVLP